MPFMAFVRVCSITREVVQDMAAQGVQRTRKPPRKIRADFVTGHACHRAKLTQGGHKFVGASGRLVSIEADSFAIALYCPEKPPHPGASP
ncbi:Uncharacterised protein [Escherichia coli]|uniref:Uncharacterized protein n=1 Tax=Escherichia coli TaxID=562 RepID=A0AAX2K3M2_ECOLX|nr:Uncharacterised protein [Escherichia coli]